MYEIIRYQDFFPQPAVGIDEAGRGCLAGPVFAGAVILNFPQKFKDSKLLSAKQREILAKDIKKDHLFGIGTANLKEIENLNIHHASLLAMKRSVENLYLKKVNSITGHLLIDGGFKIKNLSGFLQTSIIKGDRKVLSIMAAGIMAKTERDNLMQEYAKKYPNYGFERHKGYSTAEHRKAIKNYGPSPIHRKSFAGVKEFI